MDILADNCWKNLTLTVPSQKRALIVTTSHGEPLSDGKKSGLTLQELTDPYYVYLDSGFSSVDIASILGGNVPYDMTPRTPSVLRFLKDDVAMTKIESSTSIRQVNFSDYDVVFMAGGWGAAFDLGYSKDLGKQVASALDEGTPLLASTCSYSLYLVIFYVSNAAFHS